MKNIFKRILFAGVLLTSFTSYALADGIQPCGGIVSNCGAGNTALTSVPKTITPIGTTGSQTIQTLVGSINFAAGTNHIVLTNSSVTANSVALCTIGTNDASMTDIKCVAGAGKVDLFSTNNAGATTRINFAIYP